MFEVASSLSFASRIDAAIDAQLMVCWLFCESSAASQLASQTRFRAIQSYGPSTVAYVTGILLRKRNLVSSRLSVKVS